MDVKDYHIDYILDTSNQVWVLACFTTGSGITQANHIATVQIDPVDEDAALIAHAPLGFSLLSKIVYDVSKMAELEIKEPENKLLDRQEYTVRIPYDTLTPEELN